MVAAVKKIWFFAICTFPFAALAQTGAAPTPMRWVVNLPAEQAAGMLQAMQNTLGVPVNMVRPLLQPDSYLVEMQSLPVLGRLQTHQAIHAALNAMPGVRFASPDIELKRTVVPNDSGYAANQASYLNNGFYASLGMQGVWDQTRGSGSVVLAVLDSGILFDTPELKGRLLPGYDFVSRVTPVTGTRESGTVASSGSNDGDGRDADPSDPGDAPPPGVVCPDGSSTSSWHGTTVASVAAAQSNNGALIAGMDWNAKVLPVRVSGRCGIATSSDIVDAFYWATGSGRVDPNIGVNPNPADVINLSFATDTPLFGGGCASGDMVALAIADARARGVSVVVSAGNNSGGAVQYPANCPGAIAAGAAQRNGVLADYTAKGAATGVLTLHAPGDQDGFYAAISNSGTLGPVANGTTGFLVAGTSFSAPMIAGAITLLKSVRPTLTPSQVDTALRNSARPYPANASNTAGLLGSANCTSSSCGAGLLNVAAALQAVRALSNPLPVANVPNSRVVAGDGGFSLPAGLSTNSAGGSGNLTFSWQQVFGNPVVLAGTSTNTLLVQSGMAGNLAEFALTVTDTGTNRSNTSVVRLVNSSVNERTFTPSTTGGSTGGGTSTSGSGTSTSTTSTVSSGGGGGGGALSLYGLLGLFGLLLGLRRPEPMR